MNKGANSPAAPTTAEKSKGSGVPTAEGWYVLGAKAPKGRELPRSSITFGGQSFPQFCYDEQPTIKADSIEFNQRRVGQRVYLFAEDLEVLRASIGKKIVRVRSEASGSCFIMRASDPQARRKLRGDLPLESFIYIKPATDPAEDAPEAADDTLFPIG